MHSKDEENRIKSAVEIALEKTSGMKATPEEIKALNEKELETRIKGLVVKYIEGEKELRELEKELSESEEGKRGIIRSAILKALLFSIELGGDSERAIEGMAALGEKEAAGDLEELKSILRSFSLEYSKAEGQHSSSLLGELKVQGVGGSAVLPNLEDDEQWQAASQELRTAYEVKLENIRPALLKVLSPGSES